MKLLAIKKSQNLIEIIDEFEIDKLKLIPNNTLIELEATIKRDISFHRKFRGFLNIIYETIPEPLESKYPTFNVFYQAILIATGTYNYTKTKTKTKFNLGSTAFDKMDEIEYRLLVLDTINLISKKYFDLGNHYVLLEIIKQFNYY